jgi:hypothetical protein
VSNVWSGIRPRLSSPLSLLSRLFPWLSRPTKPSAVQPGCILNTFGAVLSALCVCVFVFPETRSGIVRVEDMRARQGSDPGFMVFINGLIGDVEHFDFYDILFLRCGSATRHLHSLPCSPSPYPP